MTLTKPDETYSEDYYRFVWPQFEMILERFTLQRSPEDIACELTVRSSHPTKGGTLLDGKKLLLLGPNSQRDLAKGLSERDEEPDWRGMLEQATTLARRRYREGAPAVDLWQDELGNPGKYLVKPYLFDNAVNIVYGSGDSGKSLMALLLGISVSTGEDCAGLVADRTGPILYLDWEDDASTHQERLYALCNGLGMTLEAGRIIYRRMSTSLRESSREIRKDIAASGAVLVIIDSLGMACGGDPSDAGGIIQTMMAARSLGVAVLAVHHIAKDAKDKSTPYGSVYASNEARMSWFVESTRADSTLTMVLTNYKANRGKNMGRRSYRFDFTEDDTEAITYIVPTPLSYSDSREVGSGGQKWKIAQWLKDHGISPEGERGRTPKEITEGTRLTRSNVRAILSREQDRLFVSLPGGRWGILAVGEQVQQEGATPLLHVASGATTRGVPYTPLLHPEPEETEEDQDAAF